MGMSPWGLEAVHEQQPRRVVSPVSQAEGSGQREGRSLPKDWAEGEDSEEFAQSLLQQKLHCDHRRSPQLRGQWLNPGVLPNP